MTDRGNATTRWFGEHFGRLHPLLQAIHRDGGVLQGEVVIRTGSGLAGVLGRRLGRRLGIPLDRPTRGIEVRIHHDDVEMHWVRTFDDGSVLHSVFRPAGRFPQGHWVETTGPVRMRLAVDVAGGGWRWRLLGVDVRGLPLPLWLFPRTDAGKRIDETGRYRFGVAFSLWPLGEVLRYEGALRAVPCRDQPIHA